MTSTQSLACRLSSSGALRRLKQLPSPQEIVPLARPHGRHHSGGFSIFDRVLREPASPQRSIGSAQDGAELPAHLRRQVVEFRTTEAECCEIA
jgi:hypothetical protein